MGQTSLMTGGTNKKLQTAGGKRTLIQVAQCDQGSLFSRILKILCAFATMRSMYTQYRALRSPPYKYGVKQLGTQSIENCVTVYLW